MDYKKAVMRSLSPKEQNKLEEIINKTHLRPNIVNP